MERLREIEPAALGEHQRLARRDEMDEGEHVGDHLDHGGAADRADMEDLLAHGFEGGAMALESRRVAADDDGDLARRGQMHAAGDRRLQRLHARLRGELRRA